MVNVNGALAEPKGANISPLFELSFPFRVRIKSVRCLASKHNTTLRLWKLLSIQGLLAISHTLTRSESTTKHRETIEVDSVLPN